MPNDVKLVKTIFHYLHTLYKIYVIISYVTCYYICALFYMLLSIKT